MQIVRRMRASDLRNASGDDVRKETVVELADLVAQDKLSLFQALQLQLITGRGRRQCVNGRIKIAMLLAESFNFNLIGAPLFVAQRVDHCEAPVL